MAMNLPSRHGRGRRAPMAEINVTPLVDVMLVLLIIFMVTAPMMSAGVPVNLPDSRAKQLEQQTKPLEMVLDARGRVMIGDADVTDTLPERLAAIAAASPEGDRPAVQIRADRGLGYGQVMRVMGELNHAGLNKVTLVTDPGTPAR